MDLCKVVVQPVFWLDHFRHFGQDIITLKMILFYEECFTEKSYLSVKVIGKLHITIHVGDMWTQNVAQGNIGLSIILSGFHSFFSFNSKLSVILGYFRNCR